MYWASNIIIDIFCCVIKLKCLELPIFSNLSNYEQCEPRFSCGDEQDVVFFGLICGYLGWVFLWVGYNFMEQCYEQLNLYFFSWFIMLLCCFFNRTHDTMVFFACANDITCCCFKEGQVLYVRSIFRRFCCDGSTMLRGLMLHVTFQPLTMIASLFNISLRKLTDVALYVIDL